MLVKSSTQSVFICMAYAETEEQRRVEFFNDMLLFYHPIEAFVAPHEDDKSDYRIIGFPDRTVQDTFETSCHSGRGNVVSVRFSKNHRFHSFFVHPTMELASLCAMKWFAEKMKQLSFEHYCLSGIRINGLELSHYQSNGKNESGLGYEIQIKGIEKKMRELSNRSEK